MTGWREHQYAEMPKPGGPRWLRLFTASLFLFSVNYVPLHLALEMHLDHLLTAFTQAAEGPSFKAMRAQTEDDDDHAPHFASDHLLRLAPQSPWHSFGFDWTAVETNVPVFTPQPQTPLFLTERQNPPGLPPPDPLQPRAPPHA